MRSISSRLGDRAAPGQRQLQKLHDRVPTGADSVAIAGARCSIAIGDANHRRFLADKALDSIDALHLGLVEHQ